MVGKNPNGRCGQAVNRWRSWLVSVMVLLGYGSSWSWFFSVLVLLGLGSSRSWFFSVMLLLGLGSSLSWLFSILGLSSSRSWFFSVLALLGLGSSRPWLIALLGLGSSRLVLVFQHYRSFEKMPSLSLCFSTITIFPILISLLSLYFVDFRLSLYLSVSWGKVKEAH